MRFAGGDCDQAWSARDSRLNWTEPQGSTSRQRQITPQDTHSQQHNDNNHNHNHNNTHTHTTHNTATTAEPTATTTLRSLWLKAQTGVRFLSCETFRSSPVVDMSVHGYHGSGAAKRRRDCWLRMHWRHEQLTLQMVLATVQHHSHGAVRGQSTASRTGEWGREQYYTARTRDPLPHSPAGALQP